MNSNKTSGVLFQEAARFFIHAKNSGASVKDAARDTLDKFHTHDWISIINAILPFINETQKELI